MTYHGRIVSIISEGSIRAVGEIAWRLGGWHERHSISTPIERYAVSSIDVFLHVYYRTLGAMADKLAESRTG